MKRLYLTALLCLLFGYNFAQTATSPEISTSEFPSLMLTKPVSTSIKADLKIYPNPAKNKISLDVKGYEPGMVAVRIMDNKGKQVREDSRLLVNGTEEVVMFLSLQPGIYYILLKQKDKLVRKKLVVI